jgi:8-oxo-dGTP diphosphatase
MELLLEIYDDGPNRRYGKKAQGLFFRRAARAVIIYKGKVALLHVSREGYYKLPGGGIEAGEDMGAAAVREAKEETGCDIQIREEVGAIIELRTWQNLLQLSYCFIADTRSIAMPRLTEEETRKGFSPIWMEPADAVSSIESARSDDPSVRSIVKRDSAFLKKAIQIIDGRS